MGKGSGSLFCYVYIISNLYVINYLRFTFGASAEVEGEENDEEEVLATLLSLCSSAEEELSLHPFSPVPVA